MPTIKQSAKLKRQSSSSDQVFSEARLNDLPGFQRISAVSLLLLALIVAGCSNIAKPPPLSEGERTDPDLFYYVGAGELYGIREQFDEAAQAYRQAALLSDDVEIAARAVRVAAYANDNELLVSGASRWLELDRSALEPHRIIASLYLKQADVDQAWPHIEALIEGSEPGTVWEVLRALLAQAQNPAVARDVYQRLGQRRAPVDPPSLRELSGLGVALGDVEGALRYADLLIDQAGGDPTAWAWRARLKQELGDFEGAKTDLLQAVQLAPDDGQMRQRLAELLAQQEEFELALDQLDQAEPSLGVLYSQVIYAVRAELSDRALGYYQQLQNLPVEDVDEKQFYLGQLAELLDRPTEETLGWYSEVRQGDQRDEAKLRSAIVLADAGRLDQAQAVLRRLQNGAEEIAQRAFIVEAGTLREAGRLDDAMAVYDRSLKYLPDNTDLLFNRALLAEELDDLEQTEQDLRRVLELDADNYNAMNALGYTLADRTERYDEARVLIEQALEGLPDSAAILDSMGWVLFKQGEYELALEYLRQALSVQFDQEIAAHLGEVLWVLGRHDEARVVWEDALERQPDSEKVIATRDRLAP